VSFTRADLRDQLERDEAYFGGMRANAKNALVSEIKKFWPRAGDIWKSKFVDPEPDQNTGDNAEN
jgi:hypothetical protein